jgi:hypothetical protein
MNDTGNSTKGRATYRFLSADELYDVQTFRPEHPAFFVAIRFEVSHPAWPRGTTVCTVHVVSDEFVAQSFFETPYYFGARCLIVAKYDLQIIEAYLDALMEACYSEDPDDFIARLSQFAVSDIDTNWVPDHDVGTIMARLLTNRQ